MSWSNDPAWKAGYGGYQNAGRTADEIFQHEQGRLERLRREEEQRRLDAERRRREEEENARRQRERNKSSSGGGWW